MQWHFLGSTSNDTFFINGTDIFKENWINTRETANVTDPLYKTIKKFTVWTIISECKELTFAAGEFSNNVWGIYIKELSSLNMI
ncbi:hypothetical protein [Paenibacillus radicis (ex Xue et al. 2023)]|uniref:Uncharacterized protein n=1 Tax=Paenibacillus radicis (ex Xue et al. 2023) TaxID=2972489 RepID=A0ABT1YV15_9BACL|nr:hypothetical protein [Paenibacillus radicis (ex Xue et al. 2023)]MCR8636789.1 hypothetical protein [Paenibacillus radicis (ex Xue et al. 2023)]